MFKRNPYEAVEQFFSKAEGWLSVVGGLLFLTLIIAYGWQVVGAWSLLVTPGLLVAGIALVVLIVYVNVKVCEAWWRGKMKWDREHNG